MLKSNKLFLVGASALLAAVLAASFVGPFGVEFRLDDGIFTLRFSRIMLAAIIGAALAASGCVLQSLLKNPLADPYVIGVSGGAALGGAIATAIVPFHAAVLPLAAMTGAVATGIALYVVLLPKLKLSTNTILLVGIAVNLFASAAISALKTLLPAQKTQSLIFWFVGSIPYLEGTKVAFICVILLIAILLLLKLAPAIDILSLGDEECLRLGVEIFRPKVKLFFIVSVMVGIAVAYTGMIGFVGLLVPNLLRRFLGISQRILLPASCFVGAFLVVIFDAIARLSFALVQSELPVGTICALLGAPVFVLVLLKQKGDNNA